MVLPGPEVAGGATTGLPRGDHPDAVLSFEAQKPAQEPASNWPERVCYRSDTIPLCPPPVQLGADSRLANSLRITERLGGNGAAGSARDVGISTVLSFDDLMPLRPVACATRRKHKRNRVQLTDAGVVV
jgi:hypothetical protein